MEYADDLMSNVRVVAKPTVEQRIADRRQERRGETSAQVPDLTAEGHRALLVGKATKHATDAYANLEMALRYLAVYDGPRAKKYGDLKQQMGEFADLMERQG